MPQTIESISHIKAAKIPFIVVLNKIDLPDANPNKVKNDLLQHEVMVEGKGGSVAVVEVSAKTGAGIPELLESLLLIASEANLSYDPQADPLAYIIETKKDRRGLVVSAIIKQGTLKIGDTIYSARKKAKVKSLVNDLGVSVTQVVPSSPFELLGFNELPEVGSEMSTTEGAVETVVMHGSVPGKLTLDSILHPEVVDKKLNLIIKTDTQGSLEAINYSLAKNKNIEIILQAVGEINRSDIFLAKTTKAIIIGFGGQIDSQVRNLAKQEKIIIKTYNIIYELLEELGEVADLIEEKEIQEKTVKGEAKVLATFIIEGEKIYGLKVTKGKVNLADNVELFRDVKLISKTKLVSLKQRAKSVQEVKKDQEAGMVFSPDLDMRVGDVVKFVL